jgi:DNA/RNA-binding domain of Phe-tRNA-synthetase-like protein
LKFVVEPKIFEALPDLCIGVVSVSGADNRRAYPAVEALLDEAAALAESRFAGKKVKEEPDILPYRESFRRLGINPNKYPCSVEALFTRIAKGKGMPRISPLVDLNNAVSLRYTLPMGTHDLSASPLDMELRFAREGDVFLPFGEEQTETPEPGEPIYAVGNDVRTRRWTWRQSEHGKITPETNRVFFPIDGFRGFNEDRVREAMAAVERGAVDLLGAQARGFLIDRDHPSAELD